MTETTRTKPKPTLTLFEPIRIDGVEVTELTFRRPKVRDLKRIDAVEGINNKMAALLPILCEQAITPADVEELDGTDLAQFTNIVADFAPAGAGDSPAN